MVGVKIREVDPLLARGNGTLRNALDQSEDPGRDAVDQFGHTLAHPRGSRSEERRRGGWRQGFSRGERALGRSSRASGEPPRTAQKAAHRSGAQPLDLSKSCPCARQSCAPIQEIPWLKAACLREPLRIDEFQAALAHLDKALHAHLLQDAVDIGRGEADAVRDVLLRRREREGSTVDQTTQKKTPVQLREQMRDTGVSIATAKPDLPLVQDGLLSQSHEKKG